MENTLLEGIVQIDILKKLHLKWVPACSVKEPHLLPLHVRQSLSVFYQAFLTTLERQFLKTSVLNVATRIQQVAPIPSGKQILQCTAKEFLVSKLIQTG